MHSKNQASPVASDAVSYNVNNTRQALAAAARTGQTNTSMDTMSENISSMTGFTKAHVPAGGNAPEYKLEEKMNDNLMRQFGAMFSDEKSHQVPPGSRKDNQLLNSVSEFSSQNTGSRAQLFAQAKETLMAQRAQAEAGLAQEHIS